MGFMFISSFLKKQVYFLTSALVFVVLKEASFTPSFELLWRGPFLPFFIRVPFFRIFLPVLLTLNS